ncbi:MAG: hypothetical protein NZM29_00955, partial [Nitrospira sp.]|nr:hypothetical protein [Nitrospira sp.]
METVLALIPKSEYQLLKELNSRRLQIWDSFQSDFRGYDLVEVWVEELTEWMTWNNLSRDQMARFWRLLRWLDEPIAGAERKRPALNLLQAAYDAGVATLADVADHLIGPHQDEPYSYTIFYTLSEWTKFSPQPEHARFLQKHPEVKALLNR